MGFLNPVSLLFGLSIAGLVLIYLRARSRPTIEVSSVMLFDEVPAPVARSRVLRVDVLFWLEMFALAALTMAVAGFYIRTTRPVGIHRNHALVFDLGAAMGALGGDRSRLDEAKRSAFEIVGEAPAGDEFSVVGYALEAENIHAATSNREAIRQAINALTPEAVAVRPAALRAALMDVRTSEVVDLFADREPPHDLVRDARPDGKLYVHAFGKRGNNLAIVALDPGVPKNSSGRCVLRNFSVRPQPCELRIEQTGREIFHSSLILEPRAEAMVPFGPLTQGGLVHARIITADALAADNDRYAMAPSIAQARALVMSPEPEVRDDLARIVLAVNPNFLVTAIDPSQFSSGKTSSSHFDIAVLHDCSGAGVNAAVRMFIFPEPWFQGSKQPPLLPVVSSVALAELQTREDSGALATPVLLGPSRVVAIPGWMDALARGTSAGERDPFPLAATGRNAQGEVGMIAFDVRNHLLLDPDRLDALILVVDTMRKLLLPQDVKVVTTGSFVPVSTFGAATLIAPDGIRRPLLPDRWGRVRFRPLEAGQYRIVSHNRDVAVFANYYDAAESDLALAPPTPSDGSPVRDQVNGGATEIYVEPLAMMLIAAALLLFLAESFLIARRASRWGIRHV